MHPPQQIPQTVLEGFVTVCAAQSGGGAEIGQRSPAERALRGFTSRRCHLLVNGLQKVVDLRLCSGDGRLDAALSSALLAQMQLSHPAPFDFGELDYSFAILTQIANHPSDHLIDR